MSRHSGSARRNRKLSCPILPPKAAGQASDVEPEMQDIAFLDAVFLPLQAQAAGLPRARFAAVADEIFIGHGFGADEALFEIGMDHCGGLGGGRAWLPRPRAALRPARGDVR